MKNRKNKEEGKMGRPRAFVEAKSTFAVAKPFVAAKGCFVVVKQNGQNGHPRVCCNEAMLRRGKGTIHTGQNILFCFRKSRIHALIVEEP